MAERMHESRSMRTLRTNKLFTPIQVGSMQLKHRVVMAPLTRSRSVQPGSIPGDLMLEYYSQRASDGGLIVSEGTSISIAGGGWFGAPGLYSDAQVAGWRRTEPLHFGLAYLHIIEPRIKGNVLIAEGQGHIATVRLRKVFTGRIIAAGGFEPDTAEAAVGEGAADLVAFG